MRITKTIWRSAIWNSAVMILLLITFNVLYWISINYVLNKNINSKLNHEMANILNAIEIKGDSLKITEPSEFREPDLAEITESPFFMKIIDVKGKLLLQSVNLTYLNDFNFPAYPASNETFFDDTESYREELRVQYHKLLNKAGKEFGFIQLATPKTGLNKIKDNILLYNLILAPFNVIIILLLSIFLARKTFKPVNKIIDLAEEISAASLDKRLSFEADSKDEIGRLRDTLNKLLDRLEKQVGQISNFSDNAAHQLMTPLTTLKSEIEYLSNNDHSTDEYKQSLDVLHSETENMIDLIKSLLIIANNCNVCADSKHIFYLSKSIYSALKSDIYKNVKVICNPELLIRGEKEYFQIVIKNLVDNSLKYSNSEKPIEVKAYKENEFTIIMVKDFGIGIPANEREKVFERFYRGKESLNLGIKGHGLGLSLVKSIVESMNGKIIIEENKPNGTIFKIKLPVIKTFE